MEATHIVLRDFNGAGVKYRAGQAVDGTVWPPLSVFNLVRSKYIRERTVMDQMRDAKPAVTRPIRGKG